MIEYIFVLAGGMKNSQQNHKFVESRLNRAVEEFTKTDDAIIVCMGGGTYHKPPFTTNHGYVIHESTCCAKYLIKNYNIEPNKIMREWSSYDTIGNGYFAFMHWIYPLKLPNFTVITSEFHIKRVKVIFDYFNTLFEVNAKINYIATNNSEMNNTVLGTRIEREQNSIISFRRTIKKLQTLKQFIEWFYTDHSAYCANIEYSQNSEINESY